MSFLINSCAKVLLFFIPAISAHALFDERSKKEDKRFSVSDESKYGFLGLGREQFQSLHSHHRIAL